MTQTYMQSRDKSITFMIIAITKLLEEGIIKFRILFLKIAKLFEFQGVGSKLFHLMIVEEKEEF